MSTQAWLGLILGVISIVGSFSLGVRHLVKFYLSELKPDNNGGHNLEGKIGSIHDRVSRIEAQLDQILLQLLESK